MSDTTTATGTLKATLTAKVIRKDGSTETFIRDAVVTQGGLDAADAEKKGGAK